MVEPFNEFIEPESVQESKVTSLEDKSFEDCEISGILALKSVSIVINAVNTGKEFGFNHSLMLLSINS